MEHLDPSDPYKNKYNLLGFEIPVKVNVLTKRTFYCSAQTGSGETILYMVHVMFPYLRTFIAVMYSCR